MLLTFSNTDLLINVSLYLFIYNLSLLMFFWVLLQYPVHLLKTLTQLSLFRHSPFFIFFWSSLLLSLAGVPPFIGFFSKLLILLALLSTTFVYLYIFFFVLLFVGLFFYLQHLRYILVLSTNYETQQYLASVKHFSLLLFYILISFLWIILFGVLFFDDLLLYFEWLFC